MTQETKPTTPKAATPIGARTIKADPHTSGPTKKARLIRMLSRKRGADVAAIRKEFGWLPHTTRAALSGLRKSGLAIVAEKPGTGQPTRYRIIASPADAA